MMSAHCFELHKSVIGGRAEARTNNGKPDPYLW
jgi:hypothetical protein